jgi:hypothetical protein
VALRSQRGAHPSLSFVDPLQVNIDANEFPSPVEWADPLCPTRASIFNKDKPSVLEIGCADITLSTCTATVVAAPADEVASAHHSQVVACGLVEHPRLSILWFDMSDVRTDEWLSDWGNAGVAFLSSRPVRGRVSTVPISLHPRGLSGSGAPAGSTATVAGNPARAHQQWTKVVLKVQDAVVSLLPLNSVAVIYCAKETSLISNATEVPAPKRSMRLKVAAQSIKVGQLLGECLPCNSQSVCLASTCMPWALRAWQVHKVYDESKIGDYTALHALSKPRVPKPSKQTKELLREIKMKAEGPGNKVRGPTGVALGPKPWVGWVLHAPRPSASPPSPPMVVGLCCKV